MTRGAPNPGNPTGGANPQNGGVMARVGVVPLWLERHVGLNPDATRAAGLADFIDKRVAALGCASVDEYLDLVTADPVERGALIDCATIQETHFHRNRPQVEALRRHVLPEVLLRGARANRPVTIWSAGCSTGEEAYTIGMLVAELLGAIPSPPPVRIVGTDVSPRAIERAQAGVYTGRTLDLAEDGAVARWFDPDEGSRMRVRAEVAELVTFGVHNLLDDPPFKPGEVDLVLCRNVTIYFGRETTRAVIERLGRALRVDGWMLLGHAETLWQISDDFELVPLGEAFGYRKPMRRRPRSRLLDSVKVPQAESVVPSPRVGNGATVVTADQFQKRAESEGRGPSHPAATTQPGAPELPVVPGEPSTEQVAASFLESARSARALGHYAEALESADRAIETDPLLADAYVLRGYLLSTLGRDIDAVDPLRKALFLNPAAGHVHFLLGAALRRMDDRPAALRAFRAAVETLPLTPAADIEPLLDGRPVSDLIELCRDLAEADSEVRP